MRIRVWGPLASLHAILPMALPLLAATCCFSPLHTLPLPQVFTVRGRPDVALSLLRQRPESGVR